MITDFQLFEASNLSPIEVIKTMKKKGILKPLFSKTDKVEVNKEFYDTLNFMFFNNRQVIEFFKKDWEFKTLRTKKLTDYISDENRILDNIRRLIGKFSKEVNRVEKSTLSSNVKKELLNFVNSYRYRNLDQDTVDEVERIGSLRPKNPVILYRGLLFKKFHLEKSYSGEMGYGQKFLSCIRKGTDVLKMEFDKVSSWTYDLKTAEGFARYKEAINNFDATLGWFQRGDNYIDGELGVIISIMAKPKDIIIDFNKLEKEIGFFKHGDEGECILNKGNYICRIVKAFNKKGEINIKEFFNEDTDIIDQYKVLKSDIIEIVQDINKDKDGKRVGYYYEHTVDTLKEFLSDYDKTRKMVDERTSKLKDMFKDFKPIEHSTIMDTGKQEIVKKVNDVYKVVKNWNNVRYMGDHINNHLQTSNLYIKYFTKKLGLRTNFTIKRYDWEKKKEFNRQMAEEFGFQDFDKFKVWLVGVYSTIEKLWSLHRIKQEMIPKVEKENEIRF